MKGLRLGREELIARFGVSNRLAVRIGALLTKGVQVTETVLEMAGAGSAIEHLLIHPRLLEEAQGLTTDRLLAIVAEVGVGERLAVVRDEGTVVIALEEEVLAEKGFAAEPSRETGLAQRAAPSAPTAVLRDYEARQVFGQSEVARLKLDALTSADPAVRISAIRRLQYAPISAQEKGGLYLQVLLDPVSNVRFEAIRALEGLGFDPDAAHTLRAVFSDKVEERDVALERLAALFVRLTSSEKQVVLAILTESLRELTDAKSLQHILRILTEAAVHVAERRETLTEIIKATVARLLSNPQQLERPVQQLLLRLAELAPEETAQGLSNEIETVRDPNVRACLLALVAECRLPAEKAQEFARTLLQELTREELREINRQKLGYNLIRLGEPAMGPLLEAFPAALPRQKLVLIPFLDALCVDSPVPPHHKVKVAEMLLAAAQAGDRNVRLTASRARVFHDAAVPERLRAQLARMLAQDISAYTHPDTLASLGDSLERLAASSVAPLFELVREDHRRPSADRAIRILARITVFRRAELTEGAALRSQLLHFLKALVQEASPSGGFLWALGLLASCEDVETTECREIADLLKGRLGKVPHHAELLDALGYVATRPSLPLPDRIEIARIFSTLMGEHEEGVDEILRRRETAEGIEYEFGPRAEFDSVALPVVVDAVRRICLSPATTDALRRQLLDRAIEVWDKVASWTVVWGPRSSEALANALGEIGSMAALDPAQRIRVARALGRDIKRISVVRALAALSKTPDESSEMNETLVEAGLAVLNHWMDSDIAPEERLIVLQSVATIAARAQLRRTKHVRLLRKAVAQHLLNGLREGQYWATEPLEKLRDAGAVPRELAREVETALRAALAIAKR